MFIDIALAIVISVILLIAAAYYTYLLNWQNFYYSAGSPVVFHIPPGKNIRFRKCVFSIIANGTRYQKDVTVNLNAMAVGISGHPINTLILNGKNSRGNPIPLSAFSFPITGVNDDVHPNNVNLWVHALLHGQFTII